MTYDLNNVFAKILRADIPCAKVYEDDQVLAFRDIAPKAPVHILVIPKGAYIDATDFGARASASEQAALFRAISIIVKEQNLAESGYRLIANTGRDGAQEVAHFHFHILGGEPIGPLRS